MQRSSQLVARLQRRQRAACKQRRSARTMRLPTRKHPLIWRMLSQTSLLQRHSSLEVKHRREVRASRRRCVARGLWTFVVVLTQGHGCVHTGFVYRLPCHGAAPSMVCVRCNEEGTDTPALPFDVLLPTWQAFPCLLAGGGGGADRQRGVRSRAADVADHQAARDLRGGALETPQEDESERWACLRTCSCALPRPRGGRHTGTCVVTLIFSSAARAT